jgi:hypothetical protein
MRTVAIVLFALLVTSIPEAAHASLADNLFKVHTAAERDAIRHMPLEKRPNRFGHFYGNTVRRLNKLGR